jgi:hypothetical protein
MPSQCIEPETASVAPTTPGCRDGARAKFSPKQSWADLMIIIFITGLAGVLLFWNLGGKYLWQDEAATAVLGERFLRYGKPLAYDGTNLVTIDYYAAEDLSTIEQRSADAPSAIAYYTHRGDFKLDSTWIWQPWGQFLVAAAAVKAFGHDTAGMRLPFAVASLFTVILTYCLVARATSNRLIAVLAAILLSTNSYWLLHGRQCRYYALSSLCLVLALIAYVRWRRGGRWGPALFVSALWCWFQVDYGTVLPVSAVLFTYALLTDSARRRETFMTAAVFAASIAPFCWYYQMAGRMSVRACPLSELFFRHLFNLNQYVLPILVLLSAVVVLFLRTHCRGSNSALKKLETRNSKLETNSTFQIRKAMANLSPPEELLVKTALWIIPAILFWLTMVTPVPFLRYSIIIAPVGAIIAAWAMVRGTEMLWAGKQWRVTATASGLALFLVVSPWACKPVSFVVPKDLRTDTGNAIRTELARLCSDVFGREPDPNRLVIEWLKMNAAPADEILITYEDLPLVFYLPNPIRGGIGAFRVTDDVKAQPKYAILRPSVWFVHQPVFAHELNRFHWRPVENFRAPDIVWGNNPDPDAHKWDPAKPRTLQLLQRLE